MIEILKNEKDFVDFHESKRHKSIGFVPTMGNLHQGHLSLLKESFKENDISIISIYVNPTQFGENEDLEAYPRTFKQDVQKIEHIHNQFSEKEIFIFYPENNEVIYPAGFKDYISIPTLNGIVEGEVRPTHFDGVATVVKRLFNIVRPNRAYFGKKDYQQLRLIEKLVEQEKLSVKIIGLPIIRENDGLAMSSRNNYLNSDQRLEALDLNHKLNQIANKIKENGIEKGLELAKTSLESDPRFNYLEVRRQKDLKKVHFQEKNLVLLGNIQVGVTRLLDNLEVNL